MPEPQQPSLLFLDHALIDGALGPLNAVTFTSGHNELMGIYPKVCLLGDPFLTAPVNATITFNVSGTFKLDITICYPSDLARFGPRSKPISPDPCHGKLMFSSSL
jgi:hypothetical protein